MPLADARKVVEAAQSAPIPKPEIDESWVTVPSDFGDVRVRLIRPPGVTGPLPVVLYLHGGGWIMGSSVTHDLLTRRLAVGANAVVAFVEYSLAPEAQVPDTKRAGLRHRSVDHPAGHDGRFDPTRIAVAGDSAGGNMATVLAIMAKQRSDVRFVHQSLYYPMTDANPADSESLREFRDGPYGSAAGLEWFWSSYLADPGLRNEITVSPLQATQADLEGLPPALVIVDENDVLRDQGEAYADRLRTRASPPRPCASTARSTTSCASTRSVTPNRPGRRSVSPWPPSGTPSGPTSALAALVIVTYAARRGQPW